MSSPALSSFSKCGLRNVTFPLWRSFWSLTWSITNERTPFCFLDDDIIIDDSHDFAPIWGKLAIHCLLFLLFSFTYISQARILLVSFFENCTVRWILKSLKNFRVYIIWTNKLKIFIYLLSSVYVNVNKKACFLQHYLTKGHLRKNVIGPN